MNRPTVLMVLVVALLLITGGLVSRARGGGMLSRWIAAHQPNAGH